ncbi:TetR/AcrR family transcriptional regulator [Nocardia sp. NPDC004711]
MPTRKGEATKARIVEAAADLLVTGNDVNLDDVMRLTSTSKGQLFHYFPDGKDELRRAAAERHLTRLAEADAPVAPLTTWQAWEAWIEQILHLHSQQTINDACEIAALAGRALDTDTFTRDLVGRMYERWIDELHDQLSAMQHAGLLRPDAPVSAMASAFVAALQGGAIMDKATGSHQHLTNALHQSVALLRAYEA